MSWRGFPVSFLSLLASAAPGAADPLIYSIQRLQSVVRVEMAGDIEVTYNPLLGPPVSLSLLNGTSTLAGRPSGSGVADVGLPGNFAGGANGLLLSAFQANTEFGEGAVLLTDIFGQLPPIPSPVPLVGAAFVVDIADLVVILDGSLTSELTSVSDPDEYLWAGLAPLTIEGSLNLVVQIPGQEPIGLSEPVPFSAPLDPGALLGSFTGDATSTTLVVGLDPVSVDPDTSALVQPIPIDLGALGIITVTPKRLRLIVNASYTGLNRQFGLPPATGGGFGCGIGPELAALLPALGWAWRRRRA